VTPGAQVGEVLPDERGAPAEVSELPNVDRADRLLGIAAEAGLLDAGSHE
jgi:hypothetical protein